MKKFIAALFALMALFAVSAYGEEAALPTYKVRLNGTVVKSEHREYPLLQYKGITYFPMTYYDCRFLGIVTDWDNGTRTLSINKKNISAAYRDYACEAANADTQSVEICDFNIIVNDKVIDNTKEEYPLLTFRGVTYFPLTWRFAFTEFGWYYTYSEEKGLAISSDNYHTETVELPDYDGKAIAFDGYFYYYQGADYMIYRTPADGSAYAEKVLDIPCDDYPSTAVFEQIDGLIYLHYQRGTASMGSETWYLLTPGEGLEQVDYWNSLQNARLHMYTKEYHFGDTVVMAGKHGEDFNTVSYVHNGVEGEVHLPEDINRYSVQNAGDCLFLRTYTVPGGDYQYADIYRIDMTDGSYEKIIERAGSFFAFSGRWIRPDSQMCDMLLFYRDGSIYRWQSDSGKILVSVKNSGPMSRAMISGRTIMIVSTTDAGTKVFLRADYGISSFEITLFETDAPVRVNEFKNVLCVYNTKELPGVDERFAALGGYRDFYSSDVPKNVFVNGLDLVYTTDDNKVVRVELGKSYYTIE